MDISPEEIKNPWTTLSGRFIYENPWITVREDQVIKPKGGQGIYGVVSFKNKAIGIVPLDRDNNVYLVGQYRYTLNEYTWEIPEGGGPFHTDPLDSAKRELQEETGLTADTWSLLGRIHTSNSVTDEEGFLFLAEGLHQGKDAQEDSEQIIVKKIPLHEAVEMVMKGKITDSLSMAALLMAGRIKGI